MRDQITTAWVERASAEIAAGMALAQAARDGTGTCGLERATRLLDGIAAEPPLPAGTAEQIAAMPPRVAERFASGLREPCTRPITLAVLANRRLSTTGNT